MSTDETATQAEGVLPPRQTRSARTLESLLRAAEELLAARSVESVGVAAICRRAGVSTGAFYARFQDKEALFRALEERVYAAFEKMTDDFLGSGEADLEGALVDIVSGTAEIYRTHRGAIRALRTLALTDEARASRIGSFNRELLERGAAHLLERRSEIACPDPETAVREIVGWLVTILRQLILFDEVALVPSREIDAGRLVRLGLCYLTCGEERR